MKDKLIQIINNLTTKLPEIKGNKYTSLVIYGFLTITVMLFLLFLVGWVYNTYHNSAADLKILVEVMNVFCDPGFAALLLIVLKLGVDTNNNNVADILEEEKK